MQATAGYITPPHGPGLGVTLNEDFIKRHLVAESGTPAGTR
jgi:L-alanine-DL-glutamate epimerase-like enolase superfamily enzyme